MKNLKGIVFGFIAMVAMIGGVSAVDYTECSNGSKFYVKDSETTYSCQANLAGALNTVAAGGEIVLLDDFAPGSNNNITKDVTIDLNGHKLTLSHDLTVKGANVTIKNGEIVDDTTSQRIKVDSSAKASTLTIADNVTVKGTGQSSAFIKVIHATQPTVINVNGTWTLTNEIVDCDNGEDKDLTINLDANVTGTLYTGINQLVSLDAGSSVVNVLGGSYTSDKRVFLLKNGTLNISGGTIKSTKDNVVVVSAPDSGNTNALAISGGNLSTTGQDKYSVYFNYGGTDGTYNFSNGTFTSGPDEDGNQLPAIYINAHSFLTNHPGMITGGTYTNGIVGKVEVGTGKYTYASAATNILIAEGTPSTTTENGNVIVGNSDDDQNQIVDGDNIGGTTDSSEANPNTADVNLMTLVGTILVGLVGFAYTMKNRLFN